jgi:hypothetical protein
MDQEAGKKARSRDWPKKPSSETRCVRCTILYRYLVNRVVSYLFRDV